MDRCALSFLFFLKKNARLTDKVSVWPAGHISASLIGCWTSYTHIGKGQIVHNMSGRRVWKMRSQNSFLITCHFESHEVTVRFVWSSFWTLSLLLLNLRLWRWAEQPPSPFGWLVTIVKNKWTRSLWEGTWYNAAGIMGRGEKSVFEWDTRVFLSVAVQSFWGTKMMSGK